jgi:hypothetical protein
MTHIGSQHHRKKCDRERRSLLRFLNSVVYFNPCAKSKQHTVYLSRKIFQDCHFVKVKKETLFSGILNISFCDFGSSKVGQLISHMSPWPRHGLTSKGAGSCAFSMSQSSFCHLCTLIVIILLPSGADSIDASDATLLNDSLLPTLLLLKHPF